MRRTPKAGINIFLVALLIVVAAYGQTVSPEPQNSPTPTNSRNCGAAELEDETFADSRNENENEDSLAGLNASRCLAAAAIPVLLIWIAVVQYTGREF